MSEDFYSIALSRIRNFVLPAASEHGDVALMVEVAKVEAILAVAQQLKQINDKGIVMEEPQH